MPFFKYHKGRYWSRRSGGDLYTSPRIRAAAEEEQRTRATIKSLSSHRVGLRGRLMDWLRYPFRRRAFKKLLEEKFQAFPWLASAWADYRALETEHEALHLVARKWPAIQAAVQVREAGRKRAEAERRAKIAEYVLEYYETLFPHLVEFRGEEIDELLVAETGEAEGAFEEQDPARRWLTDAEYKSLPTTEKYQLALERYWQKKKSKWELGRDYERYIGYKYESAGFTVRYQGILQGFEDLGRDLIARKSGETEVIQCKYWAARKIIHEKHVNQLFGTVTAYRIDHPTESVTGSFITSTRLSERAKQFATALGIKVEELTPLDKYPCIKCNVSRRGGEKIYHLPFDQQYDRAIIEEERLERYVETVAKAEALGFRRAYRWRGASSEQAP